MATEPSQTTAERCPTCGKEWPSAWCPECDIGKSAAPTQTTEPAGPQSMQWPTLWHKFGGIEVFRWPSCNGFRVHYRDWYFGNFVLISLGWLDMFLSQPVGSADLDASYQNDFFGVSDA